MQEVHISSLVLHALPQSITKLEADVHKHPHSELGASDHNIGRLVVVLETETMGDLKDSISYFEQLDGVLTAAMVYHHVEAPSSLNEVIA